MQGLEECMDKLGYRFKNESLLCLALTHSSWAVEHRKKGEDNERLEFLGDAVLEQLVSKYLFDTHPQMKEGALTRLRANMVCEASLSKAAKRIGLGAYLLLSYGESQCGGREKDSILSDAFEAVLAAVYLDGGLGEAEQMVDRFLLSHESQKDFMVEKDSKTAFQELIHADHKGREIRYELVEEQGPDHNKTFVMQVLVDNEPWGMGSGPSKQAAGQKAAKQAIEQIKKKCE